jgi:hypothetical protein
VRLVSGESTCDPEFRQERAVEDRGHSQAAKLGEKMLYYFFMVFFHCAGVLFRETKVLRQINRKKRADLFSTCEDNDLSS